MSKYKREIFLKVELSRNLELTALVLKQLIHNPSEYSYWMTIIPTSDLERIQEFLDDNYNLRTAVKNEAFGKDISINREGKMDVENDFKTILKRFVRDSLVDLAKTLESI